MSLSEIETEAEITAGDIRALHEELHECLRLLRKHDEMLEQFRPLLDRYATVTRSPAARWVRRRNGGPDPHRFVPVVVGARVCSYCGGPEADINHRPGGVIIDG